ncbi:MAG: hypothetical protein ACREMW_02650 [Gemmatimonadales bacterium]
MEVAPIMLDGPVTVPLALDVTEVAHESRPACETIFARDDELRVGEADALGRSVIDRRMPRARARECIRVAGAQSAEERFRLFVLELAAGLRR